jgi:hypothetical protein
MIRGMTQGRHRSGKQALPLHAREPAIGEVWIRGSQAPNEIRHVGDQPLVLDLDR